MNIEPYLTLIENLPYLEQAFVPHGKRWQEYHKKLRLEFDYSQGISRGDLFTIQFSPEKLVKILMWGYPLSGRGKNIEKCLTNRDHLVSLVHKYEGKEIDRNDLLNLIIALDKIKGVGRAIWSKILYFSNILFEGKRLLILDSKIESALGNQNVNGIPFININDKSPQDYVSYVESMNQLGSQFNVKTDKIELFLFMFAEVLRLNSIKES